MTKEVVRFIEEGGKLLAVVDPAAIGTKVDPTSFWQGLIVDFVKERSRRGIGKYYPLHIPPQDREESWQPTSPSQKDHQQKWFYEYLPDKVNVLVMPEVPSRWDSGEQNGVKKTARQVPDKQMTDQALVERLAMLLQGHEEVRAAYLFGSWARGNQRPASDVDVAVAFASSASAWDEVELQEQLAAQLGMPVRIVDLACAGPHIVETVYREGVRLVGEAQALTEERKAMGEEGPEETRTDAQAAEALWLRESAADKVRRIDRALPLLADVAPAAVLAGEMAAVRNFVGVFMLLIEPLQTLVRRVSRYAHLALGYAEPEATLRAQTALAAQVMGLSAAVVEGIGAMACLRGQLAHAYWELDAEAMGPLAPQRLRPVLEHLLERASRFVLVEQARQRRRAS